MVRAFIITCREGLEAFLIIAISLSFLRKAGRSALVPAVHWGIAAALVVSVVGGYLLSNAANQEWLNGPITLVAAASVTWLTVHMWRTGRRMKSDIEVRLESSATQPGAAAFTGVFLFTLLMISREGLETALLLIQLRNAVHLVLGAAGGVVAAAGMAWLWSRYGPRVNLGLFFQATAIFLFFFVVELIISGVHRMSEQHFLPFSQIIHDATEAWGPDSAFDHRLTDSMVLLPLGWVLVKAVFSKRPVLQRPASAAWIADADQPSPSYKR